MAAPLEKRWKMWYDSSVDTYTHAGIETNLVVPKLFFAKSTLTPMRGLKLPK